MIKYKTSIIGGLTYTERDSDGYVYATHICRDAGKNLTDFFKKDSTKAYMAEVSRTTGVTSDGLVQRNRTGAVGSRGSWVHPLVAIHLCQWCSIRFMLGVSYIAKEKICQY